jgi:hypothetical protein
MSRYRPPRGSRSSVAVLERGGRDISAELVAERNTVQLLEESLAELEREMSGEGWVRMVALGQQEFTPHGMQMIRAACRLFAIKSAIIKRGLNLRSAYVFGGGVEITARANGREDTEQDVQAVVSDFLSDPGNVRALTGSEARDRMEHCLGTDGNVFVSCFTRPLTGQVSARVIPTDEIADVICNPDDASEPWYYHRRWYRNDLNIATGTVMPTAQECYYPAVGYRPVGAAKPRVINNWPVRWDAPVIHVAVNRPEGWKFGIPDAYAALDWAKAYKEFLEDWARLVRSLSRFAFKATAPATKAAQVRTALAAAPSRDRITGQPNEAGATAVLSPDVALEAISKSGATIDSDSGRPLATMAAAALDVPVTMLLSDPGQTGARATAETLDQPTELAMKGRREVWAQFYRQLLDYVVVEAVRAPKGSLKGQIRKDPVSGREYLTLGGTTSGTVDVAWPDLTDTPVDVLVTAIQKAHDTGTVPPEVILRLLLTALGVRDVDEIVEQMIDEDGQFIWPEGPPLPGGTVLAQMARNGLDPAAAGTGPMAGDDQSDEPATDDSTGAQPGDGAPVDNGG